MQITSDLSKLRDSILKRVGALERIVHPIQDAAEPENRRSLAYVTIEIDNLVIVGLRQFTKSSIMASRTAAGTRISASISATSTEEAAAYILKSINIKAYNRLPQPVFIDEKDEKAFRDPKIAEKVLLDYSASNLNNLSLALSLNAEVFHEAKILRHFFAHRARNTFDAVQNFSRSIGILKPGTAEHLLLRARPATGVRLIDGWLSDLENFFDLAT